MLVGIASQLERGEDKWMAATTIFIAVFNI
jgi:hypothetical protein